MTGAQKASIRGPAIACGALVAAMVAALRIEGRRWWCACGDAKPWSWDVWSSHCSQHVVDPYSLSHFSHGLIGFALLHPAARRLGIGWRFCLVLAFATGWEVLENSSLVIERYRSATMSLDYLGDSVINSLGDVAACALGFATAQRLGWLRGLGLFVALDLLSLGWIRDNLTLNVLMLVSPVDAIRHWQTVGHVPLAP